MLKYDRFISPSTFIDFTQLHRFTAASYISREVKQKWKMYMIWLHKTAMFNFYSFLYIHIKLVIGLSTLRLVFIEEYNQYT